MKCQRFSIKIPNDVPRSINTGWCKSGTPSRYPVPTAPLVPSVSLVSPVPRYNQHTTYPQYPKYHGTPVDIQLVGIQLYRSTGGAGYWDGVPLLHHTVLTQAFKTEPINK